MPSKVVCHNSRFGSECLDSIKHAAALGCNGPQRQRQQRPEIEEARLCARLAAAMAAGVSAGLAALDDFLLLLLGPEAQNTVPHHAVSTGARDYEFVRSRTPRHSGRTVRQNFQPGSGDKLSLSLTRGRDCAREQQQGARDSALMFGTGFCDV
eukprot:366229-Chlamydomonas_euryale.AAC.44